MILTCRHRYEKTFYRDFFGHLLLPHDILIMVGMAALFDATVRSLTAGALLVMEVTRNYNLLLPMLVASLAAMVIARLLLGSRPLDRWLLQQTLSLEKAIQQGR